jgi:tRNA(His) guanylyltransferase
LEELSNVTNGSNLLVEGEDASTAVPEQDPSKTQKEKVRKARARAKVVVRHLDIIKDEFWEKRPWILSGKPGKPVAAED